MSGTFGNGATFILGTTTVSEITNVSAPKISGDTIDVTTHNNTTRFRDFIKGLMDGGEITIEGNMNYTDYTTVFVASVTTSLYSSTVNMPTSPSVTRWTANVMVTSLETNAPHDDKIPFSATMKVTGIPACTKV
jgi:predicted secreted protein